MKVLAYLERRLLERSFWGDVLVGVSAAAILPKPWCYIFAAISAAKALIPDGAVKSA